MWRPYEAKDLEKVLTFAAECLLDANFCNWHPGDILHWMSHHHEGKHLEEVFWLYEDPDLLALAHLPRSNEIALIVKPAARALETRLFKDCLLRLQARAKTLERFTATISVAVSDRGRIERLGALGFREQGPLGPVALHALTEVLPAGQLPEGFIIRNVQGISEAAQVAQVYNAAFSDHWTAQTYLEAMQTPGFHHHQVLVVVAPEGRFVSFLVYWTDPISKTGLFEPVGCHPEFRRLGLTRALMIEGLHRMKQADITLAFIGYNADNQAAHHLYASLGFRLHCDYLMLNNSTNLLPVT